MGYSPWGRKELDTTERLHFTFIVIRTTERNRSPTGFEIDVKILFEDIPAKDLLQVLVIMDLINPCKLWSRFCYEMLQ